MARKAAARALQVTEKGFRVHTFDGMVEVLSGVPNELIAFTVPKRRKNWCTHADKMAGPTTECHRWGSS